MFVWSRPSLCRVASSSSSGGTTVVFKSGPKVHTKSHTWHGTNISTSTQGDTSTIFAIHRIYLKHLRHHAGRQLLNAIGLRRERICTRDVHGSRFVDRYFVGLSFALFLLRKQPQSLSNLLAAIRSEEHTSELQSLMRNSYAVCCLQKKKKNNI